MSISELIYAQPDKVVEIEKPAPVKTAKAKPRLLSGIRLAVSILLLIAITGLGLQVISISKALQQSKQDLAEINHIKYGLFSVDEWKERLSTIVIHEINSMGVNRTNQKELKKLVEQQLDGLIDEVSARIKKSNEGSTKGRLKQFFIDSFVDIGEIKKGIPQYADEIIKRLKQPTTQQKLRNALKTKVESLFDRTFEKQDRSKLNAILLRTGSTDVNAARSKIQNHVSESQRVLVRNSWILIALTVGLFLIAGLSRQRLSPSQYFTLLLALLVLLATGIQSPMIDLEAKISQMSFVLFGQPVSFTNQVLYFQSKSILDVFLIMLGHEQYQMKLVGLLIVSFSIIFPLLKMISSVVYYYDFRGGRDNKWIEFFVLKSGKWSMADVLIVAIFMAYIGFNGIITSQLGELSTIDPDMTLLTTNGTTLQPGFYVFLAYTLLAILLTGFIGRTSPEQKSGARP